MSIYDTRTDRPPVTFVWLLLLAATGIVNIVSHPGIFRAFDPSRAILCGSNRRFGRVS